MLLDEKSKILLSVERAINDIKMGIPVVIKHKNQHILALSPETLSPELLSKISNTDSQEVALIITNNRLDFIDKTHQENSNAAILINQDNIKNIPQLCGLQPMETNKKIPLDSASDIQNKALELVRIAELIPSVITANFDDSYKDDNLTFVSGEDISCYKQIISLELKEACRTNLVLKNSINSKIIAYRPNIGGKEHYAIIIGKLDKSPLVRIHSSCYTGDLLDSLACDCHDQLHTAIELMHQNKGGIVLYMLQEGRGIGLINKLRTYALKEQGFDTVDANQALGFDDDERLFEAAAKILKNLKINEVQLLTNNPKKAKGLEEYGIKVSNCVPHIMETNKHNEDYIKTKSTRMGHKIGDV